METQEDVEQLEKLTGQLQGMYAEISALAKKSPNDSVNSFKLKMINKIIEIGNAVLGEKYKPFDDFESFDSDDAPTTSDITMVVAQYMEEAERFRSDNVITKGGRWFYIVNGGVSEIQSGPPTKIGKKR
jgi:hypothetical protein